MNALVLLDILECTVKVSLMNSFFMSQLNIFYRTSVHGPYYWTKLFVEHLKQSETFKDNLIICPFSRCPDQILSKAEICSLLLNFDQSHRIPAVSNVNCPKSLESCYRCPFYRPKCPFEKITPNCSMPAFNSILLTSPDFNFLKLVATHIDAL